MKRLETDFLVLGGGVAGLTAAIDMAEAGRVLVISKGRRRESSSESAQGGIAAVLGEEDALGLHLDDTIRAGQGLCREDGVKVLVEEGPNRVRDLMAWGARFDMTDGRLALAREGAHSRRRILSAGGDATGSEIMRVLTERSRQVGVTWLDSTFTVDLLLDGHGPAPRPRPGHQGGHRVVGALVLDEAARRLVMIRARAVVLATGGAGQVYARTTNPSVATGDGLAMAFRAGAVLEDMEFVQFHPTALALPRAPAFLLTEAMRGEGAVLRNQAGEAFMRRYHPEAELAPRDLVAQAIWREMATTGAPCVFLDATHLDATFLRRRFPRIDQTCRRYGLDITTDRIPVAPSAHFMMGGVKTDLWGVTTLPGLLACGEVACTGVHGANRLASNSLLEGLVFGGRTGRAAIRLAAAGRLAAPPARSRAVQAPAPRRARTRPPVARIQRALRQMMWQETGIVREARGLERAAKRLTAWLARVTPDPTDRGRQELINLLIVARAIVAAAFERTESVGAHYRGDHGRLDSRTDPLARLHILVERDRSRDRSNVGRDAASGVRVWRQ